MALRLVIRCPGLELVLYLISIGGLLTYHFHIILKTVALVLTGVGTPSRSLPASCLRIG